MKIRIDIEYDGTDYCGWQSQPGQRSIQGTIQDALGQHLGEKIAVFGASRTDSGVHARGQVAHFDVDDTVPLMNWSAVLNDRLPRNIRVLRALPVESDFDAQRGAKSKLYTYRLNNRPVDSAMDRYAAFYPEPFDWDKIRSCLPLFVGRKDFKSFQSAGTKIKTTVRQIYRFELFEEGNRTYRFELEGSGFLKQMVRNIIGTVLFVGAGKLDIADITKIFEARDRRCAGPTALARGLCLERIDYSGSLNS